tara:strand:+ start:2575 stop:2766 length:192 start_codon:yes stop_codon:yes gene_type:complete
MGLPIYETEQSERIADLEGVIASAISTILRESGGSNPSIIDTVWHSDTETLCDYLAAAIDQEV